ncbi:hypothetical protein BAUCODRAFT_22281 [Baudoinia panamericana UAMH 10762]|uniref:Uncharacterized protein n=1 Tax=Baudoinia panamericana (strain UAMH 10762) TaxID=717646 RepID=M2NHZ3_BAUPA|nr:uncharacterized protein BAUCODRAFT_22281 [Baudoinia panamericana UAMH 10762]EMC98974.1 hypothetical protein BAUCODRAFT_22281 [Baudoinia panamericana UAMH 10762]
MDLSRGSSVYSTDPSRKPTYLNYRISLESNSRPGSSMASNTAKEYVESISSLSSQATGATGPQALTPIPQSPNHSRQGSYRPSYMNHANGASSVSLSSQPKDIPRKDVPTTSLVDAVDLKSAPYRSSGLLLLFFASEIHRKTMYYVEILIKQKRYSGVAIIGSHEHESPLKQLKMDLYGLVGKLGREMAVQMYTLSAPSESEVFAVVDRAMKSDGNVRSVLCGVAHENASVSAKDIVEIPGGVLADSWQRSVGYLHAVARTTIPILADQPSRSEPGSFFVLTPEDAASPVARVNQVACDETSPWIMLNELYSPSRSPRR